VTRGELVEALVIIIVIIAWWPLIFLNFHAIVYRVALYVGSFVALGIILYRRWHRLDEGFRHSQKIVDQQHLLRYGPRPPLTLHGPPDESEEDREKK
jgi:hypothetical protein